MPDAQAAPPSDEPYPGLRSFRRDETHIFFGREGTTNTMVDRLAAGRFLAVTGASGSGKSSLVRTGLLDALDRGLLAQAGADWLVADLRPGAQPLAALAAAVGQVLAEATGQAYGPEQLAVAQAQLSRGPLGLVEWLDAAGLPPGASLLLLVDQFEETFRFRRNDEADAFVALLLESVRQRRLPVYAVITMRSDFLGECARFEGLAEAINDSQFLAPRLTRAQLREAIEGPATVYGGRVEPGLVTRLLNDSGANPDQLPLLSHVLMLLWQNAVAAPEPAASEPTSPKPTGPVLTVAAYESLGGLEGALSNHADRVLAGLTEAQQAFAQAVFRALVESEGTLGRDVRRPLPLRELATVAGVAPRQLVPVVEAFRAPGRNFLTPALPAPLTPDTMIDISHESLIRQWGRLRDWVREEFASAVTWRDLAARAALWKAGHEGRLRMPYLGMVLRWRDKQAPNAAWAARYGGDFALADRFLDSSRAARSLRRGGLAVLLFALVAGSTGFGYMQYREAQRSRSQLLASRDQLQRLLDNLGQVQMRLDQADTEAAGPTGAPDPAASQAASPAGKLIPRTTQPPATLPGAEVLSTRDLWRVMGGVPTPLLVDAWSASSVAHAQTIPYAVRLQLAGTGTSLDDEVQSWLEYRLGLLLGPDKSLPVVFFGNATEPGESYNAAVRALHAGYRTVYWYRGGLQAWQSLKLDWLNINEQADELTQRLAATPPPKPPLRAAYAAMLSESSAQMLASGANLSDIWAAAKRGAETLAALRGTVRQDRNFLRDLAQAEERLATASGRLNDTPAVIAAYQRAAEARQAIAALDPGNVASGLDYVNGLRRTGEAQQGAKRGADAVRTLNAALQALTELVARTGRAQNFTMGMVFTELYMAHRLAGQQDEALQAATQAEAIDAAIANANPTEEYAQVNLWIDRLNLGVLAETFGRLDDAIAWYRRGATRLDELSLQNRMVVSWQKGRADGHYRAGLLLAKQKRPLEALAEQTVALSAATAALRAMVSSDDAAGAKKTYEDAAVAIGDLSWDLVVARDFATALMAADLAISASPNTTWMQGHRAHALMFLGRVDEAREIYMAYRGQGGSSGRNWNAEVRRDFNTLRKEGLETPLMAEVEAGLEK